MNIRKFMFSLLPLYFHQNDSYKVNGRGLLERFLDTLGDEMQEEMVDKLEGIVNELDPTTAANEYLSLLSYTVGTPPDITGYEDVYRDQVAQAINIYKYKGTKKGYDLLFALLGYRVTLTMVIPPFYNYDSGVLYDNEANYDFTKCNTNCLEYDLSYSNVYGLTYERLTPEQEEALIKFITTDFEPINVNLRDVTYIPDESGRIFTEEFNRNFN